MKFSEGMRGRLSRAAAVGVALAVTATTTTIVTGSTTAVSAEDPLCPSAVPVGSLAAGQPVTGLTVSQGTTPEPFTGEVLGVVNDGIAPGLDMILARLTSAEIDRVGGIWAGMSGSPVYAADGRLIGAVAYGLAFGPSPVAGITPAADMAKLLEATPSTGVPGSPTARVRVPQAVARAIVVGGDASAREVGGGLSRLPVPLGISGMTTQRRLNQAAKRLDLKNVKVFRAGRAAAAAETATIVPGGNLAASVSYGDLSAVGVGTATAVCGGEVLAFGHPMTFTGPSTLTMHGADAVLVQEDPTLVPFKVANPTGPVGIIDQDRLAGLHGVLGTAPATTRVRSVASTDTGASRAGTTFISVPDAVPEIGTFALIANQDRVFDAFGKGSARVRWTVTGTRANGRTFQYTHLDRYASPFDISFEPFFDIADQLFLLHNNEFEAVQITNIGYTSLMSRSMRSFTARTVQRKVAGVWRTERDPGFGERPRRQLVLRLRGGRRGIRRLVQRPGPAVRQRAPQRRADYGTDVVQVQRQHDHAQPEGPGRRCRRWRLRGAGGGPSTMTPR